MPGFRRRLHRATGPLQQAEVLLDEVERGLAAAQSAEIRAERSAAVLLVSGAAILGGAVVVGVGGALLLRWLSRRGG